MHTYTRARTHTRVHTHRHRHTHEHTCECTHTHTYRRARTHTRVHTHTDTRMRTHPHAFKKKKPQQTAFCPAEMDPDSQGRDPWVSHKVSNYRPLYPVPGTLEQLRETLCVTSSVCVLEARREPKQGGMWTMWAWRAENVGNEPQSRVQICKLDLAPP